MHPHPDEASRQRAGERCLATPQRRRPWQGHPRRERTRSHPEHQVFARALRSHAVEAGRCERQLHRLQHPYLSYPTSYRCADRAGLLVRRFICHLDVLMAEKSIDTVVANRQLTLLGSDRSKDMCTADHVVDFVRNFGSAMVFRGGRSDFFARKIRRAAKTGSPFVHVRRLFPHR
jgi:hypothetical protein